MSKPILTMITVGDRGAGCTTFAAAFSRRLPSSRAHDPERMVVKQKRLSNHPWGRSPVEIDFSTSNWTCELFDFYDLANAARALLSQEVAPDVAFVVLRVKEGLTPLSRAALRLVCGLTIPRIVLILNGTEEELEGADSLELEARVLLEEYGCSGDETPFLRLDVMRFYVGEGSLSEYLGNLIDGFPPAAPVTLLPLNPQALAQEFFAVTTVIDPSGLLESKLFFGKTKVGSTVIATQKKTSKQVTIASLGGSFQAWLGLVGKQRPVIGPGLQTFVDAKEPTQESFGFQIAPSDWLSAGPLLLSWPGTLVLPRTLKALLLFDLTRGSYPLRKHSILSVDFMLRFKSGFVSQGKLLSLLGRVLMSDINQTEEISLGELLEVTLQLSHGFPFLAGQSFQMSFTQESIRWEAVGVVVEILT